MKKILHVISGMNAGGMETMIMNYYRNIDRNKYQFEFLINDSKKVFYEDEILSLGGRIHRVPYQKQSIFKNHKEVKNVLNNGNYDVVHVHQGITYYYPLKYAKKIGVKNRVVHNHGINRNFLKYLSIYNNLHAKRRISSLGNNFIACSKTVLDHVFTKRVIDNKNYTILPNAIDVDMYKYNNDLRNKVRSELKIGNEKVLIHVGTFTAPKNHTFLINVFNEYLKIDSSAKLILVGEGALKADIRDLTVRLGIEKSVMFLGVRNDVNALLSACDIMLFPSIYEGLPLTLIEAQASGINVISSPNISDECKVTDLVSFVKIDDPNKWVKQIVRTKLNKNRLAYHEKLLETDFSIKKATKLLEKIYDKY